MHSEQPFGKFPADLGRTQMIGRVDQHHRHRQRGGIAGFLHQQLRMNFMSLDDRFISEGDEVLESGEGAGGNAGDCA